MKCRPLTYHRRVLQVSVSLLLFVILVFEYRRESRCSVPQKHQFLISNSNQSTPSVSTSHIRDNLRLWDLIDNYPFNDDVTTYGEGEGYFIYECSVVCGGWADQIKGTIFAYMIANLTGRQFKARYLRPDCGMTNYLIPNRVNWVIPRSWSPSEHNCLYHNELGNHRLKLDLPNVDFKDRYQIGSTSCNIGKWNLNYINALLQSRVYHRELAWTRHLTPSDVIGVVYRRLFRLHPRLQRVLDGVLYGTLATPRHRLVCIHVRLGYEAFHSDGVEESRNSLRNLPEIWKWISHQAASEYDKVFVMSDSQEVIHSARNQSFGDRLVSIPGSIIHSDKFPKKDMSEVCDGVERLVLEHHLSMNCDVFVRGHSGLSVIAAAVRGSDQGLYCLHSDGTIEPCNRNDFSTFEWF